MRCLGIAVFIEGKLAKAWLVRSPDEKTRGPQQWVHMARLVSDGLDQRFGIVAVQTFVSEYPQVYPGRYGPDPADLIQLAGVVGAVAARVPALEYVGYLPRAWKSNVSKSVFTARIETRLTDADRAKYESCPASLKHNVTDAVGLGLHHLGKLRG